MASRKQIPKVGVGTDTDLQNRVNELNVHLGTLEGCKRFVEKAVIESIRKHHNGREIRTFAFCFVRKTDKPCRVTLQPVVVPVYSDSGLCSWVRLADRVKGVLRERHGVGFACAFEVNVDDAEGNPKRLILINLEHHRGKCVWQADATDDGVSEFELRENETVGGIFQGLLAPEVLH